MSVSTIGCVVTDAGSTASATTRMHGGMILVNAGALQMVINALRRDAEEGKVVRGEMADELLATVRQAPEDAQYAQRVQLDVATIAEIAESFEAIDPTDSFWVEVCRAFERASVVGITQEKQQ